MPRRFRYAVTGDPVARAAARRSMDALFRLQDVTGIPGYPARSFATVEQADAAPGRFGAWHRSPDGLHVYKGTLRATRSSGTTSPSPSTTITSQPTTRSRAFALTFVLSPITSSTTLGPRRARRWRADALGRVGTGSLLGVGALLVFERAVLAVHSVTSQGRASRHWSRALRRVVQKTHRRT